MASFPAEPVWGSVARVDNSSPDGFNSALQG